MTEETMSIMRQQDHGGGAMQLASRGREVAEVQAAMVVAKQFPRDTIQATERVIQSCTRPSLAEGALYSYARGGTEITGPSIRLAEVLAQCWGNLDYGIRELSQRNGESEVEAYCWDMETNVRQRKVFTVPHIRYTRQGSRPLKDPRDVYEQVANQGARRLRACILGVIPGDVVEQAVEQVEATLHSKADTGPEATKKLVEAFHEYGVTKAQIEEFIQRRLDSIRPAQVLRLRKIYTSIRDGMSSPEDWFRNAEADDRAQQIVDKVKAAGTPKSTLVVKAGSLGDREEVMEAMANAAPSSPEDIEWTDWQQDFMRTIRKEVVGVGEANAQALVESGIDTGTKILNASMKALLAVPGIGKQTAENLKEWAMSMVGEPEQPQDEPEDDPAPTPQEDPEPEEQGSETPPWEAISGEGQGEFLPEGKIAVLERVIQRKAAELEQEDPQRALDWEDAFVIWREKEFGTADLRETPREAYGEILSWLGGS